MVAVRIMIAMRKETANRGVRGSTHRMSRMPPTVHTKDRPVPSAIDLSGQGICAYARAAK